MNIKTFLQITGLMLALAAIILVAGRYLEKTDKSESLVESHEIRLDQVEQIDIRQSVLIETSTETIERNTRLIEKLEAKF